MELPNDDVRRGIYVVVYKDKRPVPDVVWPKPTMSGLPYRVLRVELPFCVMQAPDGTIDTIDLRDFQLKRVSKTYFNVYAGGKSVPPPEKEDGYERCVNCGTRMRQRLASPGQWRYFCPDCGSEGDDYAAP